MTDQQDQFQQEWRLNMTSRLGTIESKLGEFHLDVQKLINDETNRRRDAVDTLRADIVVVRTDVVEGKAAIRTLKWAGGVVAGLITLAFGIYEHFIRKP
jgi:hypothetical protein